MLVLAAVEFSTIDLGGFGEPWWRAGHHAFTWWSESKKIIHSLKRHHRPRHTHLAELPMGWRRGAISSHKGHKPGRSEEPDAWGLATLRGRHARLLQQVHWSEQGSYRERISLQPSPSSGLPLVPSLPFR